MNSLSVYLDRWVILDGNYGEFSVGAEGLIPLDFYPHELKLTTPGKPHYETIEPGLYAATGKVVYAAHGTHATDRRGQRITCAGSVWVVDFGVLAYRESSGVPPDASVGSWVRGTVAFGVDPYRFREYYRYVPGFPDIHSRLRIRQVLRRMKDSETLESVESTNSSDDSEIWYVIECELLDDKSDTGP